MIWIGVQHTASKEDWALIEMTDPDPGPRKKPPQPPQHVTIASGNLLLGLEALGKFQQMANVRTRMDHILQSFDLIKVT